MRRSVPNWLISSGRSEPFGRSNRSAGPAGLHRPVDDLRDLEVGSTSAATRTSSPSRSRSAIHSRRSAGGAIAASLGRGVPASRSRSRGATAAARLAPLVRQCAPARRARSRRRRSRPTISIPRRTCLPSETLSASRSASIGGDATATRRACAASAAVDRLVAGDAAGERARAAPGRRASRSAPRGASSRPVPSAAAVAAHAAPSPSRLLGPELRAERDQRGEVGDGVDRARLARCGRGRARRGSRRAAARCRRPPARTAAGGRSGGGSPRRSSRARARKRGVAERREDRLALAARRAAAASAPERALAGRLVGHRLPDVVIGPSLEDGADGLDRAVDLLVAVRERDEHGLELRRRDVDARARRGRGRARRSARCRTPARRGSRAPGRRARRASASRRRAGRGRTASSPSASRAPRRSSSS